VVLESKLVAVIAKELMPEEDEYFTLLLSVGVTFLLT
jgi:hypothetical protein